jgi:hypothetical protein
MAVIMPMSGVPFAATASDTDIGILTRATVRPAFQFWRRRVANVCMGIAEDALSCDHRERRIVLLRFFESKDFFLAVF